MGIEYTLNHIYLMDREKPKKNSASSDNGETTVKPYRLPENDDSDAAMVAEEMPSRS